MKKLLTGSILSLFTLTATVAFAQSSTSVSSSANAANSSSTSVSTGINKKFQENTEITDAKLKAENGSLSRFSLAATLSYYGPTVGDLGAADQPNPDGTAGQYETSLGGSLGARWRLNPRMSFSAGTGIKAIHPFHGMERFDTNNPYLNFNLSDRIGEVQMRNSVGASIVTVPVYTKLGETAAFNYDNSLVYNLGLSGFAIGFDTSISYFVYNRGYEPKDSKSAALYNVAVYPNLKYNISDKLSVNTSVNFSAYNPRIRANQSVLLNRTISERLGLGYAYTRDIYISPYVNFFPSNLSDDGTTINFSTVFSVL
jgi:hypothetical protein